MSSSGMWQLTDRGANLTCGSLRGRVEVGTQGERFCLDQWHAEPSQCFYVLATMLGLDHQELALTSGQRHTRGHDLISSYPERTNSRVANQLYWRAKFHPEWSASQLELILSAQTDLLDSNPESLIQSIATQARLFHADKLVAERFREVQPSPRELLVGHDTSREHILVLRNETSGVSYAEMVHPSDFVSFRALIDLPPAVQCVSTLFPDQLEKGVIRRGRISGWFLPCENDLAVAVELAKRFLDEPLPLTT